MDKVSMSNVISFSRYLPKCAIKFLFRQFLANGFPSFDQPLEQCLTEEKRGEDQNTKIWKSRERKGFLPEIIRWKMKTW